MTGLFEGFESCRMEGDGVEIHFKIGGSGAPVVLLHGYPECHATWHAIAPRLAERFTVIVPDLRGYGASEAPAPDAENLTYSKRAMGRDILAVMDRLGHERFHLVGHDRGARVSYRLAFDHPRRISKLGIVEVVPTAEMWRHFDAEMAMKAYHWTFLAQPAPLPERMVGADPVGYLEWTLASWSSDGSLDAFHPEALELYREAMRDPARIAAMCGDYRAGQSIDRETDEEDHAAGRKIPVPLHFIWSERGFPAKTGDPLGIWRRWATDVSGTAVDAGHFALEENPAAVSKALLQFLQG